MAFVMIFGALVVIASASLLMRNRTVALVPVRINNKKRSR